MGGATLLLAPVASSLRAVGEGFSNPDGWTTVLHHTALVYGLPVIMANGCGVDGDATFWGGSRILDAHGFERARAGEGPCLVAARLDYDDVRRARVRLPTLRDMNPETVLSMLSPRSGPREHEAP